MATRNATFSVGINCKTKNSVRTYPYRYHELLFIWLTKAKGQTNNAHRQDKNKEKQK